MDSYGDQSKSKLPPESWKRLKQLVDYVRNERDGLSRASPEYQEKKDFYTNILALAILIDKNE